MKALIFAAGKGVRMQPLTLERPKPLLEVQGKPLLQHIIASLPDVISEIVLLVGYKGDQIREFFKDEWEGRPVTYVEQAEPLGTGQALMLCRELLAKDEKFLLVYADDLRDKESLERAVKRDHAILVKELEDTLRFGTVAVDENDRILGLEEKSLHPKSKLVVTGAYVLSPLIFDYPPSLEANGEYYINSMLEGLFAVVPVYAEKQEFWLPIGFPEDLAKAEVALQERGQK